MSGKSLKTAFHNPANSRDQETESADTRPDDEGNGCFPRSACIFDFVLNDLFCNAYVVAHTDKLAHPNDCVEPITIDEAAMTYADTGHMIQRSYILPKTENMFSISYSGEEDWSPFEARINLKNEKNRTIAFRNALPALQDAFTEFMEDLTLATTDLGGVRIDSEKGIIRANDPVALFKVIRALVTWRQAQHDVPEEYMSAPGQPQLGPVEYRSIDLPEFGFGNTPTDNDAPRDLGAKAAEGSDFLYDDDSSKIALSNLPPRAYSSEDDLFLATYETKERLSRYLPMTRLDELEAIVLAEARGQRSYPNPLLNLH